MDYIEHLAKFMLNSTEEGNWNHTDEALERMVKVFEKAKTDCSDHPHPPHPDECREAEFFMDETL